MVATAPAAGASLWSRIGTALGYHASEQKGKRRPPPARQESEDKVLGTTARAKVVNSARDVGRNFSIAAWMVRKHLDYVCEAGFHSRTGDEGFDTQLEQLVSWWSNPLNCDAGGRFSLDKFVRMVEGRRTYDGDVGVLKLSDGTLQGIEGDRIRNPPDAREDRGTRWIQGVKVNDANRPLAYGIHRRGQSGAGFEFERAVPAGRMILHAYFDRFDQTRGISPIVAGLNGLVDVYENFDLALAKAKVSQLFAIAFTRDAVGDEDDAQGATRTAGGYEVNFGGGPVVLNMKAGEDAKFLESQTPSNQFQDYMQLMLMVVLKALDIPFSFFDESHTNFFGSRGAWLHYDRSCLDKRRDVLGLRYHLTRWRIGLAIQDGWITLPANYNLGTLPFEWVPSGMPWWDPSKEIDGDLKAISAGLDNPQRICKERGRGDFYDNVDQIAKARAYAEQQGVTLSFTPVPQPILVEKTDAPA